MGAGFLALAMVVGVWAAIDRRPPEWDHANHLERAVLCARDLRTGDVRAILERSSFYPPLVPCLAGATSMAMPMEAAAALTMAAFLGLGMAAVYLLGRSMAGGPAGVAAALLFGTGPFVVFSSLRFQLDLPLAAMVALGLVSLRATEDLTRPGKALAFGLVCGLGMLTKPTFGLYIVAPAALLMARGRRRGAMGAALAVLVAGAVSLPWFGLRLFGLGAQLDARAFAQAAESGHPEALSLAGLAFYPRMLGHQVGLGAAVLVVAGLAAAAARRQWFLLAAVAAPFVVVELIRNKNLRYTLPLLGAAAVLAALGLGALPGGARRVAAGVLVVLGLAQVSAVATGVPPNFWIAGLGYWWVPASPPARAEWPHSQILALIDRDRRGAPATVSVVPNFDRFSVSNFRYYAARDGLDLRFVRAWEDPPLGVEYMVLKTGDVGPAWTAEKARRAAARLAADPHLARAFPVIGEFRLPDGSTATIRARRVPAVTGIPPPAVAAAIEAGLRRRLHEVARDVEGLAIRLLHDEGILSGRVRRAEIRTASAALAEYARPGAARLRVRDLGVTLDDLLVNPWSALAEGRFDPLDAGRVRLETATVTLPDLQAFVAGLKRFQRSTVRADGDALAITVRQAGPDVSARVRLLPATDRPIVLEAERVRVGGVPVPGALVNWVLRGVDPFPRIASRLPFPVEVGTVTVDGQALRISREHVSERR
ncbi:MAG TPA: glycosyltransferase family 39 protein [Methylomirabilota bacterium]|nr:glycosyltransferase family 39 protein [Methylomirabilota bacterium]